MGELNRDKIDAGTPVNLEIAQRYLTGIFGAIGAWNRLIRQSTVAAELGDIEAVTTNYVASLAVVHNILQIAKSPPRGWEPVGKRFEAMFSDYMRAVDKAGRDAKRGRTPRVDASRMQRGMFDACMDTSRRWLDAGGDFEVMARITQSATAA